MSADGAELLERLRATPGGAEVIALGPEAMLVGGALRDLLLGRGAGELDVSVPGPGIKPARAIAAALEAAGASGVIVEEHPRFGTASVGWPGGRVDITQRRRESYQRPGALPDVRPGNLEEDLARRDFTINAMALELAGPDAGRIHEVDDAQADLHAGLLRVLHPQSFVDDPTRTLRLARYCARLAFAAEPETAELLEKALAGGALDSLTRTRIGAEVRLMLAEPEPLEALAVAERLGIWAALGMRFDGELAAAALLALAPDGRTDLLLLGLLFDPDGEDPGRLLDEMGFDAAARDRARAAARPDELTAALDAADRPSAIARAMSGRPPEQIASAVARGGADVAAKVDRWRLELSGVALTIGAQDLIDAGVPSGPAIGERLDRVLALRLDGEIPPGRDSELRAALEAP